VVDVIEKRGDDEGVVEAEAGAGAVARNGRIGRRGKDGTKQLMVMMAKVCYEEVDCIY